MSVRTPLSKAVRVLSPEPNIPETLQTAVIAALRWAWARIREETTVDPMKAGEEEITNEVEDLLNQRRNGQRRARMLRLFGKVVRSGQQRAAADSFRQSPDLTFQPLNVLHEVTHLGEWGLFAECKIIEPTSNHSPSKYCSDGVQRFIDGRYARCMASGLMIAYVRDGRTPLATLKSLLADATVRPHATDVCLLHTEHDRSKLESACIAVELTHVWLDARPEPPVVISRVEIHQIRGLTDLALDFAPPPPGDKGQWAVILGPNGAGKTTLLRAIALALRNLSDPKIWPNATFVSPWCQNGASGESTIAVHLAGGRAFRTAIHENGPEVFAREPKDQQTPLPLFAYGCRRGSALGGVSREVNFKEIDGPEIATLFDEDARLIHAETWLKEWHGAAASESEKYGAVFEAVRHALQELLDVSEVVIRDRQVFVTGPSVGKEVHFAALSDGYLTTAGWFLDLVARWIELAHKLPGALGAGILGRMTGLVLIDEIDLHLHPRWQIDVIPRIKKLLPKMSFVVTTHNPLTLVGARPEEIWMLSTDGGDVRAECGTEAPMLLTGGQIYSRYFGIRDLYPSQVGEFLRRYGFLSGDARRTDEEQAEMEKLRALLQSYGIDPGWEEVPQENPRAKTSTDQAKKTRKRALR